MRYDVEIGYQGALQNDRYVARVEELDRVGADLTARSRRLDWQVDAEALEVDDDGEDEHGGQQVGQIGQVLTVEGLLERSHLVVSRRQQVEQGDDGALELGAAARIYRGRTERFPNDCLANVGGNEERDARAKTVAFLEQLVQ